ncbi:MAG: DUF4345 domain-containing protein [Alphaproteobacteria bacterium]
MSTNWYQKLVLGVAGLIASGIGVAIMAMPHAFYASNGISLGTDVNLINELRAPGANLVALGAIVFAGSIRPQMARLSAFLGATIFLAYAFGRLVSLALDGVPTDSLLAATAIEIVVGGLCLLAFRRQHIT